MEENKKSKLGLGILIGVLITLVIGLSAFIIYDKVLTKDDNEQVEVENNDEKVENNTSNNNEQVKDVIENLSVDNKTAINLYDSISFYICGLTRDYYYRSDKNLASNLSNNLKTYFAARNTTKWTETEGGGRIIEESDLQQTYKQLFGKNVNYVYSDEKEIAYIEKRSDGKISYYESDTCVPEISKRIIKVEKNITQDEYYIYEKVAFLKYLGDEANSDGKYIMYYGLYSDYGKTNLLVERIPYSENIIEDYSSKLDTYKYTFKSNGDGTYHFYSVEKVK